MRVSTLTIRRQKSFSHAAYSFSLPGLNLRALSGLWHNTHESQNQCLYFMRVSVIENSNFECFAVKVESRLEKLNYDL